jgi:hypothetical protein
MTEVRSVRVFDTPSGMGGSFTVSIVETLPDGETVRLRVWYGRASPHGWVPWRDWDGFRFEAKKAALSNERDMPLYKGRD